MKKKGVLILALALTLSFTGCAREDARNAYEAGVEKLQNADYEGAITSFNETIETGKFQAYAYRGLGLSYMLEGSYADACIAFERALLYLDNEGEDFIRDVNLYLAYCRTQHAEKDKAIEIYTTMLKNETDPEVLFLRGRLYMQNDDKESARADFDKAAELSKDYALYISIYQLYSEYNMDADGAEFLKKALDIAESTEEDYYDRGLIYYYLQNYNAAEEALTEALRKDESDMESLLLLGRVYLAKGNISDARALFKEHVSDGNGAAAAYNGLALCDIAEGNYDSALENVNAGLTLNDETIQQSLLFNEIVIYENKNEWETAQTKAASYVVSYPSDENGLRENEFLTSRLSE